MIISRNMKPETLFQRRVLKVVREIPKGKVLSYKEVARKSGIPKAWRAVGNILNKNRDEKIPCHRVIRSDGKIGGYNQGARKKLLFLRKEGVRINDRDEEDAFVH